MSKSEILEFYYKQFLENPELYHTIEELKQYATSTGDSNIRKQCKTLMIDGFLVPDIAKWNSSYRLNPHRWRTVQIMLNLPPQPDKDK